MNKKTFIRKLDEYVELHRDWRTGIAWVEDGSTGCGHSCHPNIHSTGSIRGMKSQGYWGKGDRCVKSNGFIYNIDQTITSDRWDEVAKKECRCDSCLDRRSREADSVLQANNQ